MTKVKFCGLTKKADIEAVNRVKPDFAGFVFAKKSRRYVDEETAASLKQLLSGDIAAVGVFVDEAPEKIAELFDKGIIDMAQLHGDEDEDYIKRLRALADIPIIKAFVIKSGEDIQRAEKSSAEHILLDAGKGDGKTFDWGLLKDIKRPFFLAGGLDPKNAAQAIEMLHPYAVDVSSGIESAGAKDEEKMQEFMREVLN